MEAEKLNNIRRSVENLAKTAETLAAEADGFPAVLQNTHRLRACIRMMEMALGRVTMSPEKNA